jgi:ketosteroid isomerase-like protein
MRYLTLGTLVCVCLAAPAGAQSPGASQEIVAPIQKFIDSFNKGDSAGAAATHAAEADLAILDEVPPFAWHGAKAFQEWGAALEAASKQAGLTDQKVTIRPPSRVESSGDAAYVIVPAVYSYKEKGTAMREAAQMTFVLKKGASGWLIHGWTWTGPRPQRSGPTGKP